jgi:hypothetical protein
MLWCPKEATMEYIFWLVLLVTVVLVRRRRARRRAELYLELVDNRKAYDLRRIFGEETNETRLYKQ